MGDQDRYVTDSSTRELNCVCDYISPCAYQSALKSGYPHHHVLRNKERLPFELVPSAGRPEIISSILLLTQCEATRLCSWGMKREAESYLYFAANARPPAR